MVSKWSEIVSSKEAACIPEGKRKTALAIVKDRFSHGWGWDPLSLNDTRKDRHRSAEGTWVDLAFD